MDKLADLEAGLAVLAAEIEPFTTAIHSGHRPTTQEWEKIHRLREQRDDLAAKIYCLKKASKPPTTATESKGLELKLSLEDAILQKRRRMMNQMRDRQARERARERDCGRER